MVGATDGTGSSREPPMYGGLGLRLDGDPRGAAQSGTLLVQTQLVLCGSPAVPRVWRLS